jgi:hypothetical protein
LGVAYAYANLRGIVLVVNAFATFLSFLSELLPEIADAKSLESPGVCKYRTLGYHSAVNPSLACPNLTLCPNGEHRVGYNIKVPLDIDEPSQAALPTGDPL